jgi:hypothetical protein
VIRGKGRGDVGFEDKLVCSARDDPVEGVAETVSGLNDVLEKVVM